MVLTIWVCVGAWHQPTEFSELGDSRAFCIPFVVSEVYIHHLMFKNLSNPPLLNCWYANAHSYLADVNGTHLIPKYRWKKPGSV